MTPNKIFKYCSTPFFIRHSLLLFQTKR